MKHKYIIILLLLLPSYLFAQNIEIGTCTTTDGGTYHGQMFRGKPNGKGKTTYKKGNVYEGDYMKGLRHGQGTYKFADGEKYVGQWFQDQQHGQGVYYFANGNRYDDIFMFHVFRF